MSKPARMSNLAAKFVLLVLLAIVYGASPVANAQNAFGFDEIAAEDELQRIADIVESDDVDTAILANAQFPCHPAGNTRRILRRRCIVGARKALKSATRRSATSMRRRHLPKCWSSAGKSVQRLTKSLPRSFGVKMSSRKHSRSLHESSTVRPIVTAVPVKIVLIRSLILRRAFPTGYRLAGRDS